MARTNDHQSAPTRDQELQSVDLLQCTVTATGDEVTVALAGELDLSSAPTFGLVLADAVDTKPARVNIDLALLTFLDSSGIKCIVNANRAAAEFGCRIAVQHPSDMAAQVLTICGLDDLLLADTERDESSGGVRAS